MRLTVKYEYAFSSVKCFWLKDDGSYQTITESVKRINAVKGTHQMTDWQRISTQADPFSLWSIDTSHFNTLLSSLDCTLSKSRTTCQFRTDSEHQLTFLSQIKQKILKPLRFQDFSWSECNYRISENADISTVCWQSARGIYSNTIFMHRRILCADFLV